MYDEEYDDDDVTQESMSVDRQFKGYSYEDESRYHKKSRDIWRKIKHGNKPKTLQSQRENKNGGRTKEYYRKGHGLSNLDLDW